MNSLLEPPYIQPWLGNDPVRYYVSELMKQFYTEIRMALLTFTRERLPGGKPLRLQFVEIFMPKQSRCIDFRWEPLVGLLGLGFYPPPLNDEPAAGDVILNSQVFCNPESHSLVLPTLIHEIAAHSIGLGHLYLIRSVRYPNITTDKFNLSPEDRTALLTIYKS